MKIPSRDVAPQSNFRPTEANSECSFAPCGTRDAVLVDVVEHFVGVVYGLHALVSRIFLQSLASVHLCVADVIVVLLHALQEIESVLNGRRYVNLQVGNPCNFFFGHRLFRSVFLLINKYSSQYEHGNNYQRQENNSVNHITSSFCFLVQLLVA